MKKLAMSTWLPAIAALTLLATGCATSNVNPPEARANTGYVDFHAEAATDLCWEVTRFDERGQDFQRVFSAFDPPTVGILRRAFPPGRHRLRVTFLNRVITQPAEVELEIQDGRITPVRVSLTEAGTTMVESKEVNRGGTARGHHGRRTKIDSDETAMYRLSAAAAPAVAYQPKERMSYAR